MPAGSRPIWKGQLRLSLVSIGVELYTATQSRARPTFNQIHEPSGKRIRYEKVVEGIGPVEKSDIKKGYEYEKGEYVLLEDEELDAVKLETKKTIDLVQFVDEDDIPPLYFDTPYYAAPADELAEEAFRVLRDALSETRRIGLGQLALRGREYLVAIRPYGKGLLVETLRYEDELKKEATFFSDVSAEKSDSELLDVAKALIDKKTKKFDAGAFENHYDEALKELIQRKMKLKGRKITAEEEEPRRPSGENVIDLMAALKRSLEGGKEPAPSKPASARRRPGARKAPAKKTARKAPARKKAS